MSKFKEFKKATRMNVIMVILVPIALGAAGAFVWNGEIRWLPLVLSLLGGAAVHLFSNMINDLWDYRNGADEAAKDTVDAVSTNSGFLTNGLWSVRKFAAVTWTLFGIAAACGIALIMLSGPMVLLYAGLGGLIAYFYVAPPLKLGYRGKGYSEVAIFVSFGLLPVLGSYYVQTSQFDYRALLLSFPIGLLTTLILFNHHFLHWKADRSAGKRTLVVVLGEERALRFSRMLLMLAYIFLIICVVSRTLPVYALLGLITVFPVYKVYTRLKPANESAAYLPLMGASVQASTRCGLWMIATMIVQGLL